MMPNPLLLKKGAASLNKTSPYSNLARCESGIAREYGVASILQQTVAKLGARPVALLQNLEKENAVILPQPAAQLESAMLPMVQRSVAQIPWGHPIVAPTVRPMPVQGNALGSMRDIHKPIGVADYELTRALPEEFASSLPSIESIEEELSRDLAGEEPS